MDIVLIGAGHAHTSVLRLFGMQPGEGVRLTLITRQAAAFYSGMLPGLLASHYAFDEAHIDVEALCGFAGARLFLSAAVGIDLAQKRVLCSDREPVQYDLLSIDSGSAPNTADVPGAAQEAIPVKPIDEFLERFEPVRRRILERQGFARICFVGAGAGGVELLLSIEQRLRRDLSSAGLDPGRLSFFLCTAESDILSTFPLGVRRRFHALLRERRVKTIVGAQVTAVEGGALHFAGGGPLPADEIFWATSAAAAPWLAQTGLKLDSSGFIETEKTLESVSHPGVFAAGDVAALQGHRLPKAGVYAVRQAPVLAKNLRRAARGRPLQPYSPQRDMLALISTGDRYAIGTRNGIVFEGKWVWRWKDWIDRRFMRQFQRLPSEARTRL